MPQSAEANTYLQNGKGELFHTAHPPYAQELISNGWKKIPRSEYRKLKRAQKHAPATDASAQGESANEMSEYAKKAESDRKYFGENGMSGE